MSEPSRTGQRSPATTVIEVHSDRPKQAVDVTDAVAQQLPPDAICLVAVPHTTCALILSENDPDLLTDIELVATDLLTGFEPFSHARHSNPNAAAHIMSSMLGASVLLPTQAGNLRLGEWQRVILVELDGPRRRRIEITALNASHR